MRGSIVLACLIIGAALVPAAAIAAPLPFLPGLLSADDHPQGCVDCHLLGGDGRDTRLSKTLAALKNHPNVTNAFKGSNIPDACMLCHKQGSKLGSLSAELHKAHYVDLAKSVFVINYQGSCLNCHKLDLATGNMGLKSGPANW